MNDMNDTDNNGHIINFQEGKHIKVDLYKLIPNEILKSHRKYYGPLIMGYLREKENEYNMNIAEYLKRIFLMYYTL